jgi:UTP--glucose-1-phosphate uridylyltransferase
MKTCIILGGGKGTRMAPITLVISKMMLPINNKPVVHYLIDEAFDAGFQEVIIIANKDDINLRKYLKLNNDFINKKITIIHERKALGPAKGIMLAKKYIKEEYFGLIFGDDFYDSKVSAIKQLKQDRSIIGMKRVSREDVSLYGMIIKNENNLILKIIEKPILNDVISLDVVVGRFILPKKIFSIISKVNSINLDQQFIDSLNELIKDGNVYCESIDGENFDVGSKKGFIKSNIREYNKSIKQ